MDIETEGRYYNVIHKLSFFNLELTFNLELIQFSSDLEHIFELRTKHKENIQSQKILRVINRFSS